MTTQNIILIFFVVKSKLNSVIRVDIKQQIQIYLSLRNLYLTMVEIYFEKNKAAVSLVG